MPQAQGGRVVLDYETTYGQSPATKHGIILPISTFGLKPAQNLIESSAVDSSRNPRKPTRGRLKVDGPAKIPLGYRSIGYWLKALFGAPTTTGTGAYTHVFKYVKGLAIPSLVLSKEFEDISSYFVANGCRPGSFKTSFGEDSEVTADIDIFARDETLGATAYDASATELVDEPISPDQISVKEGGTAIDVISKGDISIDAALDADNFTTASGMKRRSITAGRYKITGSLEALFEDDTIVAKTAAGTTSSLEVKYTKSADMSVSFLISELIYERTSPPIDGPGGVKLNTTWRSFHQSDAGNSAIIITLKNDVATY